MDDVKLTPTGYALLALLDFGQDLSGYELRQWSEHMVGLWYTTPAQSQIYRELDKLAAVGFVTSRDVAQDKRPDKRVFRLTVAGREALTSWAAATPVPAPTLKHHLLLRLFTSDADLQPEDRMRLRALLVEHRDRLDRTLDELETQVVALEAEPGVGMAPLVAEWAAEIHRGDLRGTELALKHLDRIA